MVDLVVEDGAVTGVQLLDGAQLRADAVIVATGGAGQLFPYSTNPEVATADGIAMGLRAGAVAADLEFYQSSTIFPVLIDDIIILALVLGCSVEHRIE